MLITKKKKTPETTNGHIQNMTDKIDNAQQDIYVRLHAHFACATIRQPEIPAIARGKNIHPEPHNRQRNERVTGALRLANSQGHPRFLGKRLKVS